MDYSIPRGLVDRTKRPLMEHFGYNNACFWIDDVPAKYIALFFCICWVVSWSVFLAMMWFESNVGVLQRPREPQLHDANESVHRFRLARMLVIPRGFRCAPER